MEKVKKIIDSNIRSSPVDVADKLFDLASDEIAKKGPSYEQDGDRLSNFKNQAARLGLEPFQIWAVYFGKHIDAINNAIRRSPSIPHDESEGFESRLIDAAAYLALGYELYQEAKI